MKGKKSNAGGAAHESAQQEVLSRKALLSQIAAACGPQQHLFLAGTGRRWRRVYCDFSVIKETSYQSALATPQLFEFAHRHGCPCDCEVTDCRIVLWDDDGQYLPAEPDMVSTEAGYTPPDDR